jgi:hypothetical protein
MRFLPLAGSWPPYRFRLFAAAAYQLVPALQKNAFSLSVLISTHHHKRMLDASRKCMQDEVIRKGE